MATASAGNTAAANKEKTTGELIERPASNERFISYAPLGGGAQVDLSIDLVRFYLTTKTKDGHEPTDADVIKFMMLCRANELDPWTGDAYLVGYDTKDGPVFNLITSHQALMKRAELNPQYDGMESGVIVRDKETKQLIYRPGDFYIKGEETLLGGWARVHRKDRKFPDFDALELSVFDKGYSRWKADPAGMICKTAEASAQRKAHPTKLAGLYTREEMDAIAHERLDGRGQIEPPKKPTILSDMTRQLGERLTKPAAAAQEPEPAAAAGGETKPETKPETAEPPREPGDEPDAGELLLINLTERLESTETAEDVKKLRAELLEKAKQLPEGGLSVAQQIDRFCSAREKGLSKK